MPDSLFLLDDIVNEELDIAFLIYNGSFVCRLATTLRMKYSLVKNDDLYVFSLFLVSLFDKLGEREDFTHQLGLTRELIAIHQVELIGVKPFFFLQWLIIFLFLIVAFSYRLILLSVN